MNREIVVALSHGKRSIDILCRFVARQQIGVAIPDFSLTAAQARG